MKALPLSVRLTGAHVLRDGALQQRSLAISHGRITKGPLPEVPLEGYLVLPGIVDLHGDAFERHIAPRPSASFPLHTGLVATDRDAAANGVTTAWLAQSWSWEGGRRGPDFAEDVMAALASYRSSMMTDLRLQIRCETHTTDTAERLIAALRRFDVDYVVFNNHLDEAAQLAHEAPDVLAGWAKNAGRSPRQHLDAIANAQSRRSEVPRYLCRLAEAFDTLGIRYGSHDDPDGETRERFSMIGAKICEFPTSGPAAAVSRAVGDPVLMGAPNVVRGGSQAGNVAASDLIRRGQCDALVSDYYYPALSRAAFHLVDEGLAELPRAWAMISSTPADIMGLPDRGVLDFGKRADLVIVNATTRLIEATICGGRLTHLTGEAAARFFHMRDDMRLAAE